MCCLYSIYQRHNENSRRHLIKKLAESSNGTLDIPAKKALFETELIQTPTTQDIMIQNQLVELNTHQGRRMTRTREFQQVVERYQQVLDDELDWFEIHQIEGFANRQEIFIPKLVEKKKVDLCEKVKSAKNTSKTKIDAVDTLTIENKTFTSDSQNVHDSSVNKQLKNQYQQLKKNTPVAGNEEVELRNFLEKQDTNRSMSALKTLDQICSTGMKNSAIEDDEIQLVNTLWNRSKCVDNKDNKENIQNAIVDSLVDGVGVCSSGRCTRLLSSLVLLDYDENLSNGFSTTEQIRNEMLETANKVLLSTVDDYTLNKNKELRNVALSYSDPNTTTLPQAEEEFKDIVVQKLELELKNYSKKLKEKDYNSIMEHCIAAVTV